MRDPIELGRAFWPGDPFFSEQEEMIRSVWKNRETYIYAGNKLGKDFTAARLIILFFLTRKPCRIVTTSTKDKHLAVLWGEIHHAIRTSKIPLLSSSGGPLTLHQRKIERPGCDLSYIMGMVANEDTEQSFQGHHVPHYGIGASKTLMVGDEASSLRDNIRKMTTSWAMTNLWFGNPWRCNNFYYHALKGKPGSKSKGGDILRPSRDGTYLQRCFRWNAECSPNVKLARIQIARGEEPTGEVLVPGVLTWQEYQEARLMWDPIQQEVSLDARFPEDETVRMFPATWLDRAEDIAKEKGCGTHADAIGVDSAQGGDNTAWAAVSRKGLVGLDAEKTPDTTKVLDHTVELLKVHPYVKPEKVLFDVGGGGKEHADRLRSMGYDVRAIHFGSAALPELEPGLVTLDERVAREEQKKTYKNKRAEMYANLRRYLNPAYDRDFGLPTEILNRPRNDGGPSLREQMQAVPLDYDEEGTMCIRPKTKRDDKDTRETLTELIGCSPDELDALVLGVYALEAAERYAMVGVGY